MSPNADAHTMVPALTSADGFDLFGAPPLLAGEDCGAYDRLLARIAGDLAPQDTLEMMWVRDIADLVWETLRYRRFRSLIIDAARHPALNSIVLSIGTSGGHDESDDGDRLLDHFGGPWMSDSAMKSEVLQILSRHQMSEETIAAEAFRHRGQDIERIEKLLVSAEIRRDRVLREIAAYRDVFGAKARVTADRIIDAEILQIEAAAPEPVAG